MRPLRIGILLPCLLLVASILAMPARGELLRSPVEQCKTRLYAELERLWTPRLREALEKHRIFKEGKAGYIAQRQKLLDDSRYLGLFDATSTTALVIGQVFQSIKTAANLIEDSMHVRYGNLIYDGTRRQEIYYKLIEGGRSVHSAVQEGTEITAIRVAIDLVPPLRAVVNLAENVQTAVTMPGEHKAFASEMERRLSALDRAIADAERKAANAYRDVEEYDHIKAAVDRYCRENPLETSDASSGTDEAPSSSDPGARETDMSTSAKDKTSRLRDRLAGKTAEQWQDVNSSMEGDGDRLRRQSADALAAYRAEADRIADEMLEYARQSLSRTFQEIAQRSASAVRGGPSANCAESRKKVAAYDEWLGAARRSRSDFGGSRHHDRAIGDVTRNRNAEAAEARRRGCS